jgi:hypothetical protein
MHIMTNFEKMAVELLQIPYSNQPLREVQFDKMYAAWQGEIQQQYQIPYRMDFWAKIFSRNLTARGLLHDIPQDELREFLANNLCRSKMIDDYLNLQLKHNHVIERPDAETINIYENKRDKHGVNMGKWLNCIYTTIDGLRYIVSENEMLFTSVPALQTYIIQSHLQIYADENIKG